MAIPQPRCPFLCRGRTQTKESSYIDFWLEIDPWVFFRSAHRVLRYRWFVQTDSCHVAMATHTKLCTQYFLEKEKQISAKDLLIDVCARIKEKALSLFFMIFFDLFL